MLRALPHTRFGWPLDLVSHAPPRLPYKCSVASQPQPAYVREVVQPFLDLEVLSDSIVQIIQMQQCFPYPGSLVSPDSGSQAPDLGVKLAPLLRSWQGRLPCWEKR